tara:strand:+ start:2266 stop:2967 length:702 start_codon:yes stop_codon:yes gene_type:complete
MDKCDYDVLENFLMVGVTKRMARSDNTLHVRPPVRVTKHARRRQRERQTQSTVPVYAEGTQKTVVVTHKPRKPLVLKLCVPTGHVIGKGGKNINAVRRASGARVTVTNDKRVKILGTNQQRRVAANLLMHYVPPAPGISGTWVPRDEFVGRKSFGIFKCCRQWSSAHAFKAYRQDCCKCNRSVYPTFLWLNTGPRTKVMRDKSTSHHRSRCEACRAGICAAGGTSARAGAAAE